jgi:hypothetical protein
VGFVVAVVYFATIRLRLAAVLEPKESPAVAPVPVGVEEA